MVTIVCECVVITGSARERVLGVGNFNLPDVSFVASGEHVSDTCWLEILAGSSF